MEAWRRIKTRATKPKNLAVLRALAAWREEKAQDKNLPRTWIIRDETLADISGQLPKTPEDLKRIRNIPKEIPNNDTGGMLIDLIKDTLKTDKSGWPSIPQKKHKPHSASATIDVLKMLLKVQAAEHDVAAKLIACKDDIERLAIEDAPDISALKGWRYKVFGKEAQRLKNGEIAIGLKKGDIAKIEIK